MYKPLYGLPEDINTTTRLLSDVRHTIITPQSNIKSESHIDGRSFFKKTLDGTYSSRISTHSHSIGQNLPRKLRKKRRRL